MSGTGHDLSAGTFNQDGRIFQIEYAEKCLESKDTIVGVKCSDGIILGVVKYLESLLLVPDANNVIHTVDTHLGAVIFHIRDLLFTIIMIDYHWTSTRWEVFSR